LACTVGAAAVLSGASVGAPKTLARPTVSGGTKADRAVARRVLRGLQSHDIRAIILNRPPLNLGISPQRGWIYIRLANKDDAHVVRGRWEGLLFITTYCRLRHAAGYTMVSDPTKRPVQARLHCVPIRGSSTRSDALRLVRRIAADTHLTLGSIRYVRPREVGVIATATIADPQDYLEVLSLAQEDFDAASRPVAGLYMEIFDPTGKPVMRLGRVRGLSRLVGWVDPALLRGPSPGG
jgi:hypothetical protein